MEYEIYFDGFKWPLPLSFSDALSKCSFEQGDVLYNDKCAYEIPWGEAKKKLKYSIQITSPARSIGGSGSPGTDGVFLSNWIQHVEFEITNYKTDRKFKVSTFQGNLYMALLRGDVSMIDKCETVIPPLVVSEVDRRLACLAVEKKSKSQFLMAYDTTNELLKSKRKKIESALDGKCSTETYPVRALPEFSGLIALPTIEVAVFDIDLNLDVAESELKEAVYVPVKNKKTERERFRLRDHGLLR